MSAKHTPGPWSVVEKQDPVMVSGWHVQIGSVELPVFPYKRVYSEDRTQSGLVRDAEQMANARLISAAPDLLEALQRLMGGTTTMQDAMEANAQARAAIAKAAGESE